jgi:enoyl-CoA hydratase
VTTNCQELQDGAVNQQLVLCEVQGAVRVSTMNRPESRNALNTDLISALHNALMLADRDTSVRAVVLTGADPAFCAGLDLKQVQRDGSAYFERLHAENCITKVAQLGKPVLGAINGAAITGGMEMALGCDFLVASDRAAFADTHAHPVAPGRRGRDGPPALNDR